MAYAEGTSHTSDHALAEIERLLGMPWGLTPWELALDPGWDFLRSDPRFQALATPR